MVWVEKSAATSPMEKLPPDREIPPWVGPSRPERVFTFITPASLSPNSAGMPPVSTSTLRRVRASRLVENIAERLWQMELILEPCEKCKSKGKCFNLFKTLKGLKVDKAINKIENCNKRLGELDF